MIDNKKVMYISLAISELPLSVAKGKAKKIKEELSDKYPDYMIYTPFDVAPIDDMPYSYYMGRDIEFLIHNADVMCVVLDYDKSKGRELEVEAAKIYDIPMVYYTAKPTCRTENDNIGREKADKTFSKSVKRDRIAEMVKEGYNLVATDHILYPGDIIGNDVYLMACADPSVMMSMDLIIDNVMSGKFKFVMP